MSEKPETLAGLEATLASMQNLLENLHTVVAITEALGGYPDAKTNIESHTLSRRYTALRYNLSQMRVLALRTRELVDNIRVFPK